MGNNAKKTVFKIGNIIIWSLFFVMLIYSYIYAMYKTVPFNIAPILFIIYGIVVFAFALYCGRTSVSYQGVVSGISALYYSSATMMASFLIAGALFFKYYGLTDVRWLILGAALIFIVPSFIALLNHLFWKRK